MDVQVWLRSITRRAPSAHAHLERASCQPPGVVLRAPLGRPASLARPERINLALQGGGAHSPFTWRMLVRLLEVDLPVEGISGASGVR
jgi:predicted acylesterase/phospholipase RssA